MDSITGALWHHMSASRAVAALRSDAEKGLDSFEVKRRIQEFGPNALAPRRGRSALERLLSQFHQPLIYILIAAGVVTAALGEPVDSSVILGVVLLNAVVGYVQEAKAAGALEALARSMVTEATVVRAGTAQRILAAELVPGDLVVLRSGDKVPADMRLVSVKDLQVDESALTGESVPVQKDSRPLAQATVLADRRNMAYASTLVTYGQATGVVAATGERTEIGRISGMVSGAHDLATPLTRKIEAFSRFLLWAILALAALTFAAGVMRGESAAEMFMASVALAVGAIPEGRPAAVTVILAIGVARPWRRRSRPGCSATTRASNPGTGRTPWWATPPRRPCWWRRPRPGWRARPWPRACRAWTRCPSSPSTSTWPPCTPGSVAGRRFISRARWSPRWSVATPPSALTARPRPLTARQCA